MADRGDATFRDIDKAMRLGAGVTAAFDCELINVEHMKIKLKVVCLKIRYAPRSSSVGRFRRIGHLPSNPFGLDC